MTHLLVTTTVFMPHIHRPEDGQNTGRNMLVRILQMKLRHKIKVHLLVRDIFYISPIRDNSVITQTL